MFVILFFCRGSIDSILPPNAHEIAENRLFISVTSAKNGKNHLLSNFVSREDLVKVGDLRITSINKNAECLQGPRIWILLTVA